MTAPLACENFDLIVCHAISLHHDWSHVWSLHIATLLTLGRLLSSDVAGSAAFLVASRLIVPTIFNISSLSDDRSPASYAYAGVQYLRVLCILLRVHDLKSKELQWLELLKQRNL